MGKKKLVIKRIVEKVSIDDQGRIAIPKSIRDKHNFNPGAEFEIIDDEDKIILKRLILK
ncbi:MAG: AbrB/MazE/SpoVT family DNA-binding domain-containing protein [Candidatus Lokiarchaeota archaeon]|nr:AbrB/MazE/SpoVT family DNA-binding domain-containing protein [Candidatus Lokiarchaeota archaeon]MBD3342463.1 AbrB/MazE/SpoVT family DNA-binding domain-containing protein [Candidatus Lokiarchaeota archaeon]